MDFRSCQTANLMVHSRLIIEIQSGMKNIEVQRRSARLAEASGIDFDVSYTSKFHGHI